MNHFDRQLKRHHRMFWVMFVFNILFAVAVVGFFIWVVVSLLIHFGIVG